MDARLDVHGLLGLNVGDAHVIRNAGGVVSDTGIRPHFALEAFADLDDDVRQSIARVQASPFLVHKDSVRGCVYDVSTGRLREVG